MAAGRPELGWELLNCVGWVFIAVGLVDLALIVRPFAIGNPDFLFGSVTAAMNGLPVLATGLVFVTAYAAASQLLQRLSVLGGVLVLLAALILAAGYLYYHVAPIVLDSADGTMLTAIKKAVVKTAVQLVVYPVGFIVIGVKAIRYRAALRG